MSWAADGQDGNGLHLEKMSSVKEHASNSNNGFLRGAALLSRSRVAGTTWHFARK